MISAVIHTYNEEKNIERCLSSLAFVDEIVIIDMGSTDKTVSIANRFKTKVYNHPYTGFVEPARNEGIKKATGEWILILDADEEIPVTLVTRIQKIVKQENFDYFRISRKNIIFSKWMKHSGWWPDYQVRLFKKGAVVWPEKIHGKPVTTGLGHEIDPSESLSILHNNYQSIEQYITRLNRYSTVAAKDFYLSNTPFTYTQLFTFPTKEFINRYFVWEGYKDGIHGLALSLLQSLSELITYLKLWELYGFKEQKIQIHDLESQIKIDYLQKRYWFTSKIIEHSQNTLMRFFLRLKRKFLKYG